LLLPGPKARAFYRKGRLFAPFENQSIHMDI